MALSNCLGSSLIQTTGDCRKSHARVLPFSAPAADAEGSGPFKFTATRPGAPLGLEEAHRNLRISPAEFDEVAAELGRSLDFFKVPTREKTEVLAAFAAHKDEVTAGYGAAAQRG